MNHMEYLSATGNLSISLTNDYLFRALVQRNNRVLIALLCAFLQIGEDAIVSARVMNPIILGDEPGEESIIPEIQITYRMHCRDGSGRFPDRLRLYASSLPRALFHKNSGNSYHEKEWEAFFKASTWEELQQLSSIQPVFQEAAMTAYELISDSRIPLCCRSFKH